MSRFNIPAGPAIRLCFAAAALVFAPCGLLAGEITIETDAQKILKKSTDFLSGLEEFALVADSTLEAVMDTGQKVQFANATAMAVKRPNRFYAERVGDLVEQAFYYDGEALVLHDIGSGYYATVAAPDTLEGALDFMRDSLDIVAPGSDFMYADAYDILMDGVESGFVVGTSFIEGVPCDHLAFSKPGTDFQVWVAQGDQPLPMRVVITSSDILSAPQFSVTVREWDIVTRAAQEKFQFDRPDDVQEIDFIVLDPTGN